MLEGVLLFLLVINPIYLRPNDKDILFSPECFVSRLDRRVVENVIGKDDFHTELFQEKKDYYHNICCY